ncbi:MAG TPA: imidazolonepropionase [Steroidobacteraceae bacterium]|nr:imidazolonepropionase [Steroidobacteraceae bacterium]
MALLLTHAAELLTLAGADRARRGPELGDLGMVRDGAVLFAEGKVLRAGCTDEVARGLPGDLGPVEERNCRGMIVAPGLVDSHTHLVFAAPRLDDYEQRLAGATYTEIAAAGGGIHSSVTRLREAETGQLAASAQHWMNAARACGTTTIEVKSGYGLALEAERRSLQAAARAAEAAGMDAPRTFLGAHVVPRGADRAAYLDEIVEAMIPAFTGTEAKDYAPEFADAFCDPSAFTLEECRRVLMQARMHGLKLKLHAEQFGHLGGIGLGIELGAVSVDHLDSATAADAALLGRAQTVATLIPGANFFLGQPYAPARELIGAGAAVALATDFNPGTCPILSLPLVMSIACSGMRLSPAEAWSAATINGAAALGRAAICGSLTPGKRADAAIFAVDDHRAIPYFAGHNLCRAVVQGGHWRNTAACA